MIQASLGFKAAIHGTHRVYDIMVKVTRNKTGATPIDISDRIISYSTSHDFESRNGRLSLEIDNYDYQLSPLNRESTFNRTGGVYDPLFDSNHKVELFEGVMVNGAFEYVKKFEGYMGDEINVSSSPTINISCRDKSKLMQDTYIYQGPSYALYLVEDVIQDLIDEFLPKSGIQLEVLTPTQYMIGRPDGAYVPKDTNLWDACQILADSASHELRFLEDGRLIMRRIEREFSNEPAQLVLNLSNLIGNEMGLSDANVRNHIVVKVQGYDPITKKDADSIAKYGMRYMEVHRSMSDLITDVSQAHELATNILRDLRFAHPTESAEIPLHPLVQVGDIVEVVNPMLGTTSEDDVFKVIGVQNAYSKDRKRTSLELVGYDHFITEVSVNPRPPTSISVAIQKRVIQNYANSGWTGYEKEIHFPMLKWTPPTLDVDGNPLDDNFGGYVVERQVPLYNQLTGVTLYRWVTIASIPSYISALGKKVDYFYDYSCSAAIQKAASQLIVDGAVRVQYRISAINSRGKKSTLLTSAWVNVPLDRRKDPHGNYVI